MDLSTAGCWKIAAAGGFALGITLAATPDVAPPVSTYDEPTVMWRMRRGHLRAHAVIGLRGGEALVTWFLNDRPLYVRDFEDLEAALQWSDRLRDQNWASGWRLVIDDDEASGEEYGD